MQVMTEQSAPQPNQKFNLLELLLDAGFNTQKELANAAGLSESSITQALQHVSISRLTALKIIRALRANGVVVEVDQIDWVVAAGKPGRRWPQKGGSEK